MRSLKHLLLSAFILLSFSSCITSWVVEEGIQGTVKPTKIHEINSFGKDEQDNIVINFQGSINKKKAQPYHLIIPLKDMVTQFKNSSDSVVIYDREKIQENSIYKKFYLLDEDRSELTPPIFAIELDHKIYRKEHFKGTITPLKGNIHTVQGADYVQDQIGYLREGLPESFVWDLEEPLTLDGQPIQKIAFTVEPYVKKDHSLLLLLPVALGLDVLTLAFQAGFGIN